MFIVYRYWDYHKEFSVDFLGVFNNKDSAIRFAEESCGQANGREEDRDDKPLNWPYKANNALQKGDFFDEKDWDSNYGRIAVDRVGLMD